MPDIAAVLKAEIARIARKELRSETEALKKAAARHRTEIAALKRQIAELEESIKAARRLQSVTTAPAPSAERSADHAPDGGRLRFSAKGLASNRQRLGLSAASFGQLIGVSGQSIYLWEAGKAFPSAKYVAAIAALRGIGKREAAARLATLASTN